MTHQPSARARRHPGQNVLFARTALAGAAGSLLLGAALPAAAAPTGGSSPSSVASAPTISTSGATTTVKLNQSRTIIDWNSFDVSKGESVDFLFGASNGIVLNRVNGAASIDGALKGCVVTCQVIGGNVWLYASNGVIFGPNARVNVGSLLATTTPIGSDLSFLSGSMGAVNFQGGQPLAKIDVAAGAQIAAHGGSLALIAPEVDTEAGSSIAATGTTLLGAAQNFVIHFADGEDGAMDLIDFQVPASALKDGSVSATPLSVKGAVSGGSVVLAAVSRPSVVDAVISLGGTITATGAKAGANGDIVLTASGAPTAVQVSGTLQAAHAVSLQAPDGGSLDVSGQIAARDGAGQGGTITLGGAGVTATTLEAGGVLDASSSATGLSGGEIDATGSALTIAGQVLARGPAGGGAVKLGGGARGQDPSVFDATTTLIGSSALIDANATVAGRGGRVTVWSNTGTTFQGAISAQGGATKGDGGAAEVSGGQLAFEGAVDLRAPHGLTGSLLLDPNDVAVTLATDSSDGTSATASGTTTETDYSQISVVTIDKALASANVTVVADNGGKITFVDPAAQSSGYVFTGPSSGTALLTFNAAGGFQFAASGLRPATISASTGLGLSFISGAGFDLGGATVTTNGGTAAASGDVSVSASTINLSGGMISTANTLGGTSGAISLVGTGAVTVDGVLNAGSSGTVSLSGLSITQTGDVVVGQVTAGTLNFNSGGTVQLQGGNAVGSLAWSGAQPTDVLFTNGAALTVQGKTDATGSQLDASGTVILATTAGDLTLSKGLNVGGDLTLTAAGQLGSPANTVGGDYRVTADSFAGTGELDPNLAAASNFTVEQTGTGPFDLASLSPSVTGGAAASTGLLEVTADQGAITEGSAASLTFGGFSLIGQGVTLGALTANSLGVSAMSNGSPLQIQGALNAPGQTVTLASPGSSIVESAMGTISAAALSTTAEGGVSLTDANNVGTLAATLTGGGLSFDNGSNPLTVGTVGGLSGIDTSAANGSVSLTGGGLTLSGPLNLGTGGLTLSANGLVGQTGYAIDQTGGAITAGTLSATANGAGAISLAQSANVVTEVTDLQGVGVSLVDGASYGLTLQASAGAVIGGGGEPLTITNAGKITVASGTSLSGGGGVTLTATGANGSVEFQGNYALGGDTTVAAPAGVTFDGAVDGAHALTSDVMSGVTVFAAGVGQNQSLASLTTGAVTLGGDVSTSGAIQLGATLLNTATGSTVGLTSTGGGVSLQTVDANAPGAQALAVDATGGFSTGAAGQTHSLSGLGVTAASATFGAGNDVGTLAVDLTGAGALTFDNGPAALTVGSVGGVAGLTTQNSPIALSAGALTVAAPIDAGATSAVSLSASAGAIGESGAGAITAGALSATASGGAVALNGANAVTTLSSLSGTGASFYDAVDAGLTVDAANGGTGAVVIRNSGSAAGQGGLAVPAGASLQGAGVTLTSVDAGVGFSGALMLMAPTTVNAATTVTFGGTVDGNYALTSGTAVGVVTTFEGAVGGNASLASLTAGASVVEGNISTGAGGVSLGATTLSPTSGNVVTVSSGGAVTVGTVDSDTAAARSLFVDATGPFAANGLIGGVHALQDLGVEATTTTFLTGGAGNDVATLAAKLTGGGLSFDNGANALVIGTVAGSGSNSVSGLNVAGYALQLSAGSIAEGTGSGDVIAAAVLNANAGTGAITLVNTRSPIGNVVGTVVNLQGGGVSFTDAAPGGLTLDTGSGASGAISGGTGTLTIANTGPVTVAGGTALTSAGAIALTGAGLTVAASTSAAITSTGGDVDLTATGGGALSIQAPVQAGPNGTVALAATGSGAIGSITETDDGVTSAGGITGGSASFNGGVVTLTGANAVGSLTASATGAASFTNSGNLSVVGQTLDGDLTVTVTKGTAAGDTGALSVSSPLTVGGDAILTAAGALSVTSPPTPGGAVTIGGDATLTAKGGALSISAPLVVGGDATLTAAAGLSTGGETVTGNYTIKAASFGGAALSPTLSSDSTFSAEQTSGALNLAGLDPTYTPSTASINGGLILLADTGAIVDTASGPAITAGYLTATANGGSITLPALTINGSASLPSSGAVSVTAKGGGITLDGQILAGGQTVTLLAAGDITQSVPPQSPTSGIVASTLSATSSGGAITLSGANAVYDASLSGVGVTLEDPGVAGLMLDAASAGAAPLSITAPAITVIGPVSSAQLVSLTATGGALTQTGGTISAGDFIGSAQGGINLTALSTPEVGELSNTGSGDISATLTGTGTGAAAVVLAGARNSVGAVTVSDTGGGLDLTGAVEAGSAGAPAAVTLSASGLLTQTSAGVIGASTLSALGGAGVDLSHANNAVATLSLLSDAAGDTAGVAFNDAIAGALTVASANGGGGGVTLVNAHGLSLTGAVVAGGGQAVSLTASSGAVGESGSGAITAASLSASGVSIVLGGANGIGQVTQLSANGAGGVLLADRVGQLQLVSADSQTGPLTISNTGAIELTGGAGSVQAGTASSGQTVSLTAEGLLSEDAGASIDAQALSATGGGVRLGQANTVATLTQLSDTGSGGLGATFVDTGSLLVQAASSTGGNVSLTSTGGGVTLSGSGVSAAGHTVSLTADGAVSQDANGAVAAAILTGQAGTGFGLGLAANAVGQILNVASTGGTLVLADTVPLQVSGTISAPNVQLSSTGAIQQDAASAIAATSLRVSATGGLSLDGQNSVATVAALDNTGAGGASYNNAGTGALGVGAANAGSGDLVLTTAGALSIDGALVAGPANGTQTAHLTAASVSEASGGSVTAGVVTGAAANGDFVLSQPDNAFGRLGPGSATGALTLADTQGLDVAAPATAGSALSLTAASLTVEPTAALGGSSVTLTTTATGPAGGLSLSGTTNTAGQLALNAGGDLDQAGPIAAGSVVANAGGAITVAANLAASGLVSLSAAGGPIVQSAGALTAGSFTGSAHGGVVLTALSTPTVNSLSNGGAGDIAVTLTGGGTTVGPVSNPGGAVSILAPIGVLEFTRAVTAAGPVQLTAQGALQGVSVQSSGGAVSLTGAGVDFTGGGSGLVSAATSVTVAAGSGDASFATLSSGVGDVTISGRTIGVSKALNVGRDLILTGANFTGAALSPTFATGTGRDFLLTDTAGGLTFTSLHAPRNLVVVATDSTAGDSAPLVGGALTADTGAVSVTASSIALSGPVTALQGTVSLTAGAGPITLGGAVDAGANAVTLNAAGAVNETGAGSITAANLTVAAGAGVSLGGGNAVASVALANAGGGSVVFADSMPSATIQSVATGGGDIVLSQTGGALVLASDLVSPGAISLNAAGPLSGGALTAQGGAVTVGAQGLDLAGDVTAATGVSLSAGSGGATLQAVTAAGGGLNLSGAGVSFSDARAAGAVVIASTGAVGFDTAVGGQDVTTSALGPLSADGVSSTAGGVNLTGAAIGLNAVNAGAQATLDATAGGIVLSALTTGADATLTAGGATVLGSAKAGGSLSSRSGGAFTASSITVGGNLALTAAADATVGALASGAAGDLSITAKDIVLGAASGAPAAANRLATGATTTVELTAPGSVSVDVSGPAILNTVSAGGDVSLASVGGDLSAASLAVGGGLNVAAGAGSAQLGVLSVGGPARIVADLDVILGAGAAPASAAMTLTAPVGGLSVAAGRDALISYYGGVSPAAVSAGRNVYLASTAGAVTLPSLTAGGEAEVLGGAGVVLTQAVTGASLTAVGSGGDASLDSANVGGDLSLSALAGSAALRTVAMTGALPGERVLTVSAAGNAVLGAASDTAPSGVLGLAAPARTLVDVLSTGAVGGVARVDVTGDATLDRVSSASGAVVVEASGVVNGAPAGDTLFSAATNLNVTAGGAVAMGGQSSAAGQATVVSGDLLTLDALSGADVTLRANDLALSGLVRATQACSPDCAAPTLAIESRTGLLTLGDPPAKSGFASGGMTLDDGEMQRLQADSVALYAGDTTNPAARGNLQVGNLTLSTAIKALQLYAGPTAVVDVAGTVTPAAADSGVLAIGAADATTGWTPRSIYVSGGLGSGGGVSGSPVDALQSVSLNAVRDILIGGALFQQVVTAAEPATGGPNTAINITRGLPIGVQPSLSDLNRNLIVAGVLALRSNGYIVQENTGAVGQQGGILLTNPTRQAEVLDLGRVAPAAGDQLSPDLIDLSLSFYSSSGVFTTRQVAAASQAVDLGDLNRSDFYRINGCTIGAAGSCTPLPNTIVDIYIDKLVEGVQVATEDPPPTDDATITGAGNEEIWRTPACDPNEGRACR